MGGAEGRGRDPGPDTGAGVVRGRRGGGVRRRPAVLVAVRDGAGGPGRGGRPGGGGGAGGGGRGGAVREGRPVQRARPEDAVREVHRGGDHPDRRHLGLPVPGTPRARRHRDRGRAAGQGDAAARQPAPGRRAAHRLQTRPQPRRPHPFRAVQPEHRRSQHHRDRRQQPDIGNTGTADPAAGAHDDADDAPGSAPAFGAAGPAPRQRTGANGATLDGSLDDQDEPLPFDGLSSGPTPAPWLGRRLDPGRRGSANTTCTRATTTPTTHPTPARGQLCPAPPAEQVRRWRLDVTTGQRRTVVTDR